MNVLDRMTPGDRLRTVRMERGVSQTDLASRLKIRPNNVSMWESGQVQIPYKRLREIADILDTSPEYLMKGENGPSNPVDNNTGIPPAILRRTLEALARDYDFIHAEPTEFAAAVLDFCLAEMEKEEKLRALQRK